MCTGVELAALQDICLEQGINLSDFFLGRTVDFYDSFCKVDERSKEVNLSRFERLVQKILKIPENFLINSSGENKMEKFLDILNSGDCARAEKIEAIIFN